MVRVAILGATGYTALELIKLLLRHPEVEITTLTSRQEGSPQVGAVHPALLGRLDLRLEDLGPVAVASRADCVFSCLPHGVTATIVPHLLSAGAKVVDFSADYRLDDAETFKQWYGEKHPDPERLGKTVYGLPELFREEIVKAQLVANPGCYPTSAILPLTPLVKAGLIEPRDIIVDSKSGVSGAGRTPKLTTHFPECNESVSAYNVGRHRHTPRHWAGNQRRFHAAFDPDGSRHFDDDLLQADRQRKRGAFAWSGTRVLRRRAVCARGRSPAGHERHHEFEFLRHHRAAGPRASNYD
jgi:N-acetyl-gamma-glutamyl-phosphate reductase